MKLYRNTTADGTCKYAVIRNDKRLKLDKSDRYLADLAIIQLITLGLLEDPKIGDPEEFFLIKLKDRNSAHALWEYATSIQPRDPEFAAEVAALAKRSGEKSPYCKDPD